MARKISFDPPPSGSQASAELPDPASRVRPLLGLDRPVRPASALGAISQSLGDISEKVKRADEIEQRLIQGQTIVDLDPATIDGSFVADRMEGTEADSVAFRELIRHHGQAVPILVRRKPTDPDRYEVAFGHRRLRAARELNIKVRAVVRALTDEELVIAQGQENSGRTDLTFIERARFAARLEERQFSREVIMAALTVDKAALSRLIAIATRVPAALIDAIGPAPSFGRTRWQDLADLLETKDNRQRALAMAAEARFRALDTDKRLEVLLMSLRPKGPRSAPETLTANDGTRVAKVVRQGNAMTITFDQRITPEFGDYVREKLASLFEEYRSAGHKQ